MKNKYLALFMAVVLCFTFLFSTAAMALDLEEGIPDEVVGDVLEDVLKEDPGVVGDEIVDGVYEARDFLRVLTEAIDNFRIILTNFLSDFFSRMGIGESNSIFG